MEHFVTGANAAHVTVRTGSLLLFPIADETEDSRDSLGRIPTGSERRLVIRILAEYQADEAERDALWN